MVGVLDFLFVELLFLVLERVGYNLDGWLGLAWTGLSGLLELFR